jgi:hypothetical protein
MGNPVLYSVAVSDFNRDGKLDLALANVGSYDTNSSTYTNSGVSVLMGNGDGSFESVTTYAAGSIPFFVAADDFNGDGKTDVAVANRNSDNISVLTGNGDGTFAEAVNYQAGTEPSSIAVGDFNADSKLDLKVVNFGSDSISQFLGNGDGTFRTSAFTTHVGCFEPPEPRELGIRVACHPVSLAVGDFDRDGNAGLAVADSGSSWFWITDGDVSVFLNSYLYRLNIARSTSNLILSWSVAYTNFVLESKAGLDSTNWRGVSAAIQTNNGRFELSVPFSESHRYFRLRKL